MPDGLERTFMQSVIPGPDTARAFRDALGRFATGVTVVTVPTADGPLGITANSFSSVSLDPPLVLWSPAIQSLRFPHFANAEHYAIHVIGADKVELCHRFAKDGRDFVGADWQEGPEAVPLLNGCLARFLCRHSATHDGGDHKIIVGEVLRADWHDGDPVIFSQGRYGRFTSGV